MHKNTPNIDKSYLYDEIVKAYSKSMVVSDDVRDGDYTVVVDGEDFLSNIPERVTEELVVQALTLLKQLEVTQ